MAQQKKQGVRTALTQLLNPQSWDSMVAPGVIMSGLLTLLIFLLPYERIPSLPISLGGMSIDLRLSFIAGGLLVGLVCVAASRNKSVRNQLRHPLYLLLALFLFTYLLSVLVSTDVKRAITVWVFTIFTMGVGVAVSLAWPYRNDPRLTQALRWTTWIVIIFGFYQYIGDLAGLSTGWTGLRDIYTKVVFGVPRIQSTGLEPLYYANFLLIPFFYFSARFLRGEEERPYLLIAIVTQLILTVSRGALYAGIIGLVLLFALTIRKLRFIQGAGYIGLIGVGAVLALNMTALPTPQQTTGSGQASTPTVVVQQATNLDSQDDRVRNRDYAIQAFMTNPIVGIGPGNFSQYAKDRYVGYKLTEGYIIVNNEPLELLAEGGIIGFGLIGVFVAWLLIKLIKITWSPTLSTAWACGLAAYFVALIIQYQAFSTLYIMHIWVMIGIALGVVLTTKQLKLKK